MYIKQRIYLKTILIPIDPFAASENFYRKFTKKKNVLFVYLSLKTSGFFPIPCTHLILKSLEIKNNTCKVNYK